MKVERSCKLTSSGTQPTPASLSAHPELKVTNHLKLINARAIVWNEALWKTQVLTHAVFLVFFLYRRCQ